MNDEEREKVLTFLEKWLRIVPNSEWDIARQEVAKNIVETKFVNVGTRDVRDFWINYVRRMYPNLELDDLRWLKIFWYDTVYILCANYYEHHLHNVVRQTILDNYLKKVKND